MSRNYIALIGLGMVGAPLAKLLFEQYKEDFILLSSNDFLHTLTDRPIYINGKIFSPKIVTRKAEFQGRIKHLFVCVKNYHVTATAQFLKTIIDDDTVVFPLQNGIYSFEYFQQQFPANIILEGFAKGPNTTICENGFVYQKPGSYHVGSSRTEWIEKAKTVRSLLLAAQIDCEYACNIKQKVWKKMMLNVAGNAVTALTEIDYCMFKKSPEAQKLCIEIMQEFAKVAACSGIAIAETDIADVIEYYLSFAVSKHTSMLDDVLNHRRTENEYIAGYISKLAKETGVAVPKIDMLYALIKIKEAVYLGHYK